MSAVPGDGRLQPWETVQSAADGVYRTERAAILATLIRQVRDFQLAEDALQDAFVDAVSSWPRDGVPANPAAWISTTSKPASRLHCADERNRSMRSSMSPFVISREDVDEFLKTLDEVLSEVEAEKKQ